MVEGQEQQELAGLSPGELEALRGPDTITKHISLLEARCAQLRPNLGAIAEYKKKVHTADTHTHTHTQLARMCAEVQFPPWPAGGALPAARG